MVHNKVGLQRESWCDYGWAPMTMSHGCMGQMWGTQCGTPSSQLGQADCILKSSYSDLVQYNITFDGLQGTVLSITSSPLPTRITTWPLPWLGSITLLTVREPSETRRQKDDQTPRASSIT